MLEILWLTSKGLKNISLIGITALVLTLVACSSKGRVAEEAEFAKAEKLFKASQEETGNATGNAFCGTFEASLKGKKFVCTSVEKVSDETDTLTCIQQDGRFSCESKKGGFKLGGFINTDGHFTIGYHGETYVDFAGSNVDDLFSVMDAKFDTGAKRATGSFFSVMIVNREGQRKGCIAEFNVTLDLLNRENCNKPADGGEPKKTLPTEGKGPKVEPKPSASKTTSPSSTQSSDNNSGGMSDTGENPTASTEAPAIASIEKKEIVLKTNLFAHVFDDNPINTSNDPEWKIKLSANPLSINISENAKNNLPDSIDVLLDFRYRYDGVDTSDQTDPTQMGRFDLQTPLNNNSATYVFVQANENGELLPKAGMILLDYVPMVIIRVKFPNSNDDKELIFRLPQPIHGFSDSKIDAYFEQSTFYSDLTAMGDFFLGRRQIDHSLLIYSPSSEKCELLFVKGDGASLEPSLTLGTFDAIDSNNKMEFQKIETSSTKEKLGSDDLAYLMAGCTNSHTFNLKLSDNNTSLKFKVNFELNSTIARMRKRQ